MYWGIAAFPMGKKYSWDVDVACVFGSELQKVKSYVR